MVVAGRICEPDSRLHRIAKRGRKAFGLSKIWGHRNQRFVHGSQRVSPAVLIRGVVFPWRFEFGLSMSCGARAYCKTTQIAADLITGFEPPGSPKVRMLVVAFWLYPTVTKACESAGLRG